MNGMNSKQQCKSNIVAALVVCGIGLVLWVVLMVLFGCLAPDARLRVVGQVLIISNMLFFAIGLYVAGVIFPELAELRKRQ